MRAQGNAAVGPEFTAFLRPFERLFANPATVQHFRNYSRGLLTDLPRKTAEPLAKYAGVAPRNLQQFLKVCLWDHDGLVDAVQQSLRAAVAELPTDPVGTVGVIDETSARKQGNKTPGVQRQYLGCLGKVGNGVVTVHLTVAHGPFKAMLDSELYLPESWEADRERCRAANIPDDIHYRSKWDIALELIARTERNNWRFDWLTFDEWYGGKPGFLRVLDVAGMRYVGEVPKTFSCRPGRSQAAISAEALFSRPGVKKRAAVVPHRSTNWAGRGVAGKGRGRGSGQRSSAATSTGHRAESGDGRGQIFHHERAEADRPATRADGRVQALECETYVPRREKRSRHNPLRRAQLCVVETSFGVVPCSLSFRQSAHAADAGVKTRWSPWSKSAKPWSMLAGGI